MAEVLDFALEKILLDHDDNAVRLVECFKYLNDAHGIEDPVTQYNRLKKDYPSLRQLACEDLIEYENRLFDRTREIMYKIINN